MLYVFSLLIDFIEYNIYIQYIIYYIRKVTAAKVEDFSRKTVDKRDIKRERGVKKFKIQLSEQGVCLESCY